MIHETLQILSSIKKKYAEIMHLTESINDDAVSPKCQKALTMRAGLLNQIDLDQKKLQNEIPTWKEYCLQDASCEKISKDIQLMIISILSLDTTIKKRLRENIRDTRAELSSLQRKSHAALSYSKHTR